MKERKLMTPDGLGLGYDPQIHEHKEVFVNPRAAYIGELLRQVAHVSKRVVAVVDEAMLPQIEDKWAKLPRNLQSLESFFDVGNNIPSDKKSTTAIPLDQQETWLEFIEKQVIMDVLFEPFLFRNFLRFKAFPYDPEGFLGSETAVLNLFTFWDHYQDKYVKQLKSTTILEEEFDDYMRDEGYDLKGKKN